MDDQFNRPNQPVASMPVAPAPSVIQPVSQFVPQPTPQPLPVAPSLNDQLRLVGVAPAVQPVAAPKKPFKTAKMALAFVVFMLVMVGATYAFSRGGTTPDPNSFANQGVTIPEQDLGDEIQLDGILDTAGEAQTLIVNGDIRLQGSLDLNNGDYLGQIAQGALTGDQTYTLPDASGTVCLDTNNCSYAGQADLDDLQADLGTLLVTGVLNGQTIGANASFSGSATIALNLIVGGALTVDSVTADGSNIITIPTASGTLCLTSGNCVGTGGYGNVMQGGNSFGGEMSLGTNDNFAFKLKANGSDVITLLPTGNVGIGTTDPTEKLHISGSDITFGTLLAVQETNITAKAGLVLTTGTAARGRLTASQDTGGGNSGYLAFETRQSAGSLTERMRLNQDGALGIGTTSPSSLLSVAQNIDWWSGNGSAIGKLTTVGGQSAFVQAQSGWSLDLAANGSSTAHLRINNSGNVSIGNQSPGSKLHIQGTADDQVLIVQAHSTQTVNLQEWHNSSGVMRAAVDASGNFDGRELALGNAAGGAAVKFRRTTGTEAWRWYSPDDPNLYLRDMVNSRMLLTASPNATNPSLTVSGRVLIDIQAAGSNGLIITGAASQTANIQEWRASGGTIMARVLADGSIYSNADGNFQGRVDATRLFASAAAANQTPLTIQGFTGQSVDLTQWKNTSGGTTIARVSSGGAISAQQLEVGSTAGNSGAVVEITNSSGASWVGLRVRGHASQSSDLQQWQDSSGTTISSLSSTGRALTLGTTGLPGSLIINGSGGGASILMGPSQKSITENFGFNLSDRVHVINQGLTLGYATNPGGLETGAGRLFLADNSSAAPSIFGWGGGSGTAIFSQSGVLKILSVAGSALSLENTVAGTTPLTVKAAASQTADLTQWQSSAGNLLASVNQYGEYLGGSLRTNYNTGGTTNTVFESRYINWTNPKFIITGDGKMSWGAGGVPAVDINLYRHAAASLRTNGSFLADSEVQANVAGTAIRMGAVGPSSTLGILFGSNTNLYSSAADTLKTDDSLIVQTAISGTSGSANAHLLQVTNNSSTNSPGITAGIGLRMENGGNNANGFMGLINNGSGSDFLIGVPDAVGNVTDRFRLNTVGLLRLHAYGAGTLVTDASGNVTASSDERLKDIQGNFSRGLSDLLNINPILYKWNGLSGLETNSTYAGFSAQNIQVAIPEAVATDSRGFLTLQDRPVLAASVNAIKELHTSQNSLESRLAALESAIGACGDFTALNVTGTATLAGLTVTGNASIAGDLTVASATVTGRLTIAGHLVTAGAVPSTSVLSANISVVIEGNDSAGKLVITASQAMTAGQVTRVNFAQAFAPGKQPRVILSAANKPAAAAGFYTEDGATANTYFDVSSLGDLAAGETYVVNYWVVE